VRQQTHIGSPARVRVIPKRHVTRLAGQGGAKFYEIADRLTGQLRPKDNDNVVFRFESGLQRGKPFEGGGVEVLKVATQGVCGIAMLHRLSELDTLVRRAYADFDYKRIFAALNVFMTTDLSAFYFDIRKDALYCDPISSTTRKASLTVIDQVFRATVLWLAPMLPFTAEEAWLARYPSEDGSVHLELFPELPASWRDEALAEKWRKVRNVRRVVTGAIEIERAQKRIGSSLEAAPIVYVSDPDLFAALTDIDLAEVSITSAATLVLGDGPPSAFRLDDVKAVAVEVGLAEGTKCARSWKILPSVGSDPAYPDVSPRDAQALREWDAMRKAAE